MNHEKAHCSSCRVRNSYRYLGIGLTTPPVGAGLFVGCMVGKTTMEKVSVQMLVLWPAMITVLLLTTYVPWFTTFLPSLAVR